MFPRTPFIIGVHMKFVMMFTALGPVPSKVRVEDSPSSLRTKPPLVGCESQSELSSQKTVSI